MSSVLTESRAATPDIIMFAALSLWSVSEVLPAIKQQLLAIMYSINLPHIVSCRRNHSRVSFCSLFCVLSASTDFFFLFVYDFLLLLVFVIGINILYHGFSFFFFFLQNYPHKSSLPTSLSCTLVIPVEFFFFLPFQNFQTSSSLASSLPTVFPRYPENFQHSCYRYRGVRATSAGPVVPRCLFPAFSFCFPVNATTSLPVFLSCYPA